MQYATALRRLQKKEEDGSLVVNPEHKLALAGASVTFVTTTNVTEDVTKSDLQQSCSRITKESRKWHDKLPFILTPGFLQKGRKVDDFKF